MAKGTAICKCQKCGGEFKKEKICHKRSDANSWEEWAVNYYDLCNDCYKAELRKKEKEKGLLVSISFNDHTLDFDESNDILFVFSGDTYSHKDELKSLGSYWENDRWVIYTSICNFYSTYHSIVKIATIEKMPSNRNFSIFVSLSDKRIEKKKAMEKELAELGNKPSWPEDVLSIWPDGARWNNKFYGSSGRWCIYLLNKKIPLSDELKKSMEDAYNNRCTWTKKKKEIESKYK